MNRLACLSIHTEKLHQDAVWQVVQQLAATCANDGAKLTFFVHPFWPEKARIDISERVHQLASLGHEIGQHTHFYDACTGVVPGHKTTDISPDNALHRLEEDYTWLERVGIRPAGFVSGGWAWPELLVPWLTDHGFAYDCTARSYQPDQAYPFDPSPTMFAGGLVEIPTTAPLRHVALRVLRKRPPGLSVGGLRYELVYCHDDDLLEWRKRLALRVAVAVFARKGYRFVSVGELVSHLRPALEIRP
ncbi:MAG: hypothetical protein AB1563_11475 [Bacillota bacterium]